MVNEGPRRAVSVLAQLVAEMRVTHRELDNRLGWSKGLTSRILRRKDIRLGQLFALLQVLGVEPLAFFKLAYKPESLPARILEHLGAEQEPLPPLRLPAAMTEDHLKDLIKDAVRQALGEAEGP
jgi:transcriptional regulator with XRE-family HTH domain